MDQETAIRKLEKLNTLAVSSDAIARIQTLATRSYSQQWQLLHLDEESGVALVISTQCVALMAFDKDNCGTWGISSLRSWLNGDFFASLSAPLQERVLEAPIEGAKDRVFLLSVEEAGVFVQSDTQRIAKYRGNPVWWWLRSYNSGFFSFAAANVKYNGEVDGRGRDVANVGGVRPALFLNLDA
jgi:hypothetical protein